jgi:hypothetical protein
MRVFLKAQPGPIAPSGADAQRGDRPRTNGNGGAHDGGEASAFRELLTEFRNLTERYGQALLALGEARGEVAGLRSRVDLLEARLDLRLPGPAPEAAVPWTPAGTESAQPMGEPPATRAPAPFAERGRATREPAKRGAPKRGAPKRGAAKRARVREAVGSASTRRRPTRARRPAVSSIAEALARADDPTISDLTGAREEAEALATLQAEEIAAVEVADQVQVEESTESVPPGLVTEPLMDAEPEVEAEAAAEAEPDTEAEPEVEVAAEERSVAAEPMTIEPEPDWFADGDFAWLDVAEMEGAATPVGETEADIGEPAAASSANEPILSAQADDAEGQINVEMAIPEVAAELLDEPHEESGDQPLDGLNADTEDESDDQPDDGPDRENDDEPGWGASPAAAAAETESEIQAAFDELPGGGAARTPTESETRAASDEIEAAFDEGPATAIAPTAESEIQVAFEVGPTAAERPAPAAAPRGDEVEVAVIDTVMPPMADEPLALSPTVSDAPAVEPRPPRPPFDAVFSAPQEVVAVEAQKSVEEIVESQDAGAAELESASSWRPQSQDTSRPSAPAAGLQLSDAELAQLAADEGWDPSEVDAIRTLIGRGAPEPEPRGELPGAEDLREAMAALDAIPIETGAARAENEADEEWWRQPARPASQAGGSDAARPTPRGVIPEPFPSPNTAPDPEWLRRRRGPAADAYRRIRRLFTG